MLTADSVLGVVHAAAAVQHEECVGLEPEVGTCMVQHSRLHQGKGRCKLIPPLLV